MNAFLEFIPLIAFFLVAKSHGVVMAAGAFMLAMVIVLAIQFIRQGYHLRKSQWFILFFTIIFCSLTLLLKDPIYVKWKTPIINWLFAAFLLISLLINKIWLQQLGTKFLNLTTKGWKVLTWVFIGYFAVLGGLHYFFAFYFPEEVWINFKVFWASGISFIFMGGVLFSLRKNLNLEEMQKMQEENDKNKQDKKDKK